MATVLVALTRSLLDASAAAGLDAQAISTAAALGPHDLDDVDARIPLETHARVWDAIAATGGDIGLALGAHIGTRTLGVVGYAMQRASTVAEALICMQRFRPVVFEDAVPGLRFEAGLAVLSNTLPPRFAQMRHPAEAQLAGSLAVLRAYAGERVVPARVCFQHPRPADTAAHDRLFGCAITFDAPATELAFDAAILARPLPDSDPDLHRYLVTRASELLDEVGEPTWRNRAQRAIADRLAQGEPSLDDIARALATSGRTLHRRLKDEQTSFAEVLENLRHTTALVLLRDRALAVYQVAHLLGYSENAAFTRAFRRWTGETPEGWRERERQ